MPERMLKASEVAGVLGYRDLEKVRRIMREEMMHMEQPLRVPESALQGWINGRMYRAGKSTGQGQGRTEDRIPRRNSRGVGA